MQTLLFIFYYHSHPWDGMIAYHRTDTFCQSIAFEFNFYDCEYSENFFFYIATWSNLVLYRYFLSIYFLFSLTIDPPALVCSSLERHKVLRWKQITTHRVIFIFIFIFVSSTDFSSHICRFLWAFSHISSATGCCLTA